MMVTHKTKICTGCGMNKSLNDFHNDTHRKDKKVTKCKECCKIKRKEYTNNNKHKTAITKKNWNINNSHKVWARNTLIQHRRNGYIVDLEFQELTNFSKDIKNCNICGCELNWNYGTKNGIRQFNSPSLDRIDNGEIINKNTIQVICSQCNESKGARSMNEFINYCKVVINKHGQLEEQEDLTKKGMNDGHT